MEQTHGRELPDHYKLNIFKSVVYHYLSPHIIKCTFYLLILPLIQQPTSITHYLEWLLGLPRTDLHGIYDAKLVSHYQRFTSVKKKTEKKKKTSVRNI